MMYQKDIETKIQALLEEDVTFAQKVWEVRCAVNLRRSWADGERRAKLERVQKKLDEVLLELDPNYR